MVSGRSLRTQFGILFLVFAGLFVANYATVHVISETTGQRYAVSVLADSQRARSQRVAKEVLQLESRGPDAVVVADLRESIQLFSETMNAMLEGGTGATSRGGVRLRVTPAEGLLESQLREADRLWQPIRTAAETIVNDGPEAPSFPGAADIVVAGNLPLLDALAAVVDSAESDFSAIQDIRRGTAIVFLVIAGIVGIAAWQWLRRGVVTPISRLASVAREVAAGNLTVDPPRTTRNDEVGALGEAVADMTASLRGNIQAQQSVTDQLAVATNEIVTAATQLTSGATAEAAAVAQISTSVDEVRATAEQATARAQEVAATSARANEVALVGKAAVDAAQEGMADLRGKVEMIAERILALSEQTQSIGDITATVNELADQSNLLAVNAAIEAAKAGEHGRGFAVVAQEVRNLADQSREATEQIRSLLGDIQKSAHGAVMVTEQGTKGVEDGTRLLDEAGGVIDQLARAVSEGSELAREIAAGSAQQRTGVDQVGGGIEEIARVARQTAAAAQQLQTEAEGMVAVADELKALSARFTVPERSGGARLRVAGA